MNYFVVIIDTTVGPNITGLSKLEWLSLDNNQLSTVSHVSFLPLVSLNGLNLHQNPWNCTCHLKPFIKVRESLYWLISVQFSVLNYQHSLLTFHHYPVFDQLDNWHTFSYFSGWWGSPYLNPYLQFVQVRCLKYMTSDFSFGTLESCNIVVYISCCQTLILLIF